jgi:hypothetical protein
MADELRYRSFVDVDALEVGECTIHAVGGPAPSFWHVWFRVNRDSDGQPAVFCVPVAPNGTYSENGPGGKTWGLTRSGVGAWQVAPSINVLATPCSKTNAQVVAGAHENDSLWHHTPMLVGVPDGEKWQ